MCMAVLLCLTSLVPLFADLNFWTFAESPAWDGTTADSYAGGDGSEGNPYQIANGAQLAKLVQDADTAGKYYELTADILLNDVSSENWAENESSLKKWFSGSQVFHGTFNGAGHTVSGLYINAQATSYWQGAGLFQGLGSGALVKNVGLTKASITFTGNGFAGGIAGYAFEEGASEWVNPRIESCYGDGSASVTGATTGGILGGSGNAFDIADCFFAGKVSGNEKETGGILGNSWAAYSLSRCYVVDNAVFGVKNTAAIEKYQALYTTKEGLWACTTVSRENMTGGSAKTNMPGFDWDNTWMTVENGLPIQQVFQTKPAWDGTTADSYAGGDGSEGNPYQIANGAQLAKLVQDADTAGKYYELTADILLNDVSSENWAENESSLKKWFSGSQVFHGTFNGAGHTVSGLYINAQATSYWQGAGLFQGLGSGALVKNVGLTKASITFTGNGFAGGIAGYAFEEGASEWVNPRIESCYGDGSASVTGATTGGILGGSGNAFDIADCFFAGKVSGNEKETGGILGNSWAAYSLSRCYVVDNAVFGVKNTAAIEKYQALYTTKEGLWACTTVSRENMTGGSAKTNMPGFDWDNTWMTVENGLPIQQVFQTKPAWDGTTADSYAGGDGSEGNPYQIANGAQLAKLVQDADTAGKYYELTADILLNDVSSENWIENEPNSWIGKWGTDTGPYFQGHLEGNGHKVSGIYIVDEPTASGGAYYGLFPVISSGAVIRNVGVTNSYISSRMYVGAIAGFSCPSGGEIHPQFSGCYADETVTLNGTSVGGILGGGSLTANFDNCYFTGTLLTTGNTINGIVGDFWSSDWSLINSYVRGYTVYRDGFQPKICMNVYSTVEQSGVKALTVAQMTGEAAKKNMSGFDWGLVWESTDSTPILLIIPENYVPGGGDGTPGEVWTGQIATNYAGGSGTKRDPYQIATGEQLAKLVQDTDTAGKYYKLTADILLNDVSKENWKSDLPREWFAFITDTLTFRGHLEGGGHVVRGLYLNQTPATQTTYCFTGLLPVLGSGAVVRNVGITDAELSSKGYVGAIAGYSFGNADDTQPQISGCYADSTVNLKGETAGGILGGGSLTANFDNCYFTGKLNAATAGLGNGIVGNFWATNWSMINSYAVGYPMYRDGFAPAVARNVYSTVNQASIWTLTIEQMTSGAARNNMKGFDWNQIWKTTDGTPALRVIPEDYQPDGYDGTPGEVWTGQIATNYAGGSGTKRDPYQIATGEQLAKLVQDTDTAGKYYKLTADILLNDVSKENWKSDLPREWFAFITDTLTFRGHLEGGGHVVRGLYLNQTPATQTTYCFTGLLPVLGSGAVVRNVGITDAELSSKGYVGAIAGYSFGNADDTQPQISGCYADSTVNLKGETAGGILGGGSLTASFDNCYFTGKLNAATTGLGNGIVGNFWATNWKMISCYAVGYPMYRETFTPSICRNAYGTVEQYGVTLLTLEQMTGEAARKNMAGFDWRLVWKTTDGTPALKVIPDNYLADGYDGTPGEVWTGQIATNYAGGSGTKSDPYQIATGEQLAKLVYGILSDPSSTQGKYYVITQNIRLNDTSAANWTKQATPWFIASNEQYCFKGTLDGAGHVVSGIYVDYNDYNHCYAALIPVMAPGAVIKNVGVTDSYIRAYAGIGEGYAAAIVAYQLWGGEDLETDGLAQISSCFGSSTVQIGGISAGGILAGSPRPVLINDCYFVGKIDQETVLKGGILGNCWTSLPGTVLTNCYSATADKDMAIGRAFSVVTAVNTYSTAPTPNGVKTLSLLWMRGSRAVERMQGFDFTGVWKTLDNATPVLRVFASDHYSNRSDPEKTAISFVTNGGTPIETIYGMEGEPIEWPETTRYGYKLEGWYVYPELDVRYPMDVFPMADVTLYAKWDAVSFRQGFEDYSDYRNRLGEDYVYYRPGTAGYNSNFVHEGIKSIHRIGQTDADSDFVLFGDEIGKLAKGTVYEMTFWVYIDEYAKLPTLSLVLSDGDTVEAKAVSVTAMDALDASQKGSWQKITFTFTADAAYARLRTSGQGSLYFDDFMLMPVGTGDVPVIGPGSESSIPEQPIEKGGVNMVLLIVGIAVLVLGAVAIVLVILLRKKRTSQE